MTTPVKWRYVAIGVGFLVLAGVRAVEGAPWWAVVFVLAAGANGWLAVHEARPHAHAEARPVDLSEVDRSVSGYRASARQWQIICFAGVLVGGFLLVIEPALAVFAGAAALFALHRARRAGRAVATLRQAAAVGR